MIGGSFEIHGSKENLSRFNKISRVEITKFPIRLRLISNPCPFSISFSKTERSILPFFPLINNSIFVKKRIRHDFTPLENFTSRREFESHRSQFQSPRSVAEPKTCCIHIYSKWAVRNGITILCAVIRGGNFRREATQREKEERKRENGVVGRG